MSRATGRFECLSSGRARIRALMAILFSSAIAFQSSAATISEAELPDGTWKVTINGRIDRNDDKKFFEAIRRVEGAGDSVSSVRFNSPGGFVDEGMSIARFIKKRKFMTVLENNTHCESICFFMFMHGNKKLIGRNVKLGIHGASRNGKDAPDATWELYEKHMDFFIPEYLGRGINGIPSSEMYYLTLEDLQAMGLDCLSNGICRSAVLN